MNNPATPVSPAGPPRAELTLRGLVLGVLITVVFTAANVYFGLKAGLTFATSIPARGDFDGGAARLQGHDRPGKQHRADRRLGGRHALLDHLRAAGHGDDRLVDRLSLLGFLRDLCAGRDPGGDVFDPAAARVGDAVRSALPGGRCLRRGAQGRRRRARRCRGGRGQPGRPRGGGLGRDRCGGLCLHRGDAHLRERRGAVFPPRR